MIAILRWSELLDSPSKAPPNGNVHFSGDIVTAGGSSAPGQALIFVILDYITNHAGELYLLEQTSSRDGES